jgi:hypothetical protein
MPILGIRRRPECSHTVAHTVSVGFVRVSADIGVAGWEKNALFHKQEPTPAYYCSLEPASEQLTVNQRVVGSSPTSGARQIKA